MIPRRCTYRVQLGPHLGFAGVAALADQLAALGVSHVYLSPILQAVPGSTHGYDVVDHGRISDDLGGADGFRAMSDALRERGLGILVDIVPNHMAIHPANRWWWDVLESGRASRYALFFDVSWDPPEPKLKDTILLPVLGDHYGRELEAGTLRLERRGARVLLTYHDRAFPIAVESLDGILGRVALTTGLAEAAGLAHDVSALPSLEVTDGPTRTARHERKLAIQARLERLCAEDGQVVPAIDREIARLNGDADALDALVARQHYRVAFWRTAARELDYRRFFDINELVALRVEDEDVFDATHERIVDLAREGRIEGVRVDHVDGLRDPAGYLARLRDRLGREAWILVEKILHPEERLRASWPVDGTTGYEWIDAIGGVAVDPRGEAPLTRAYAEFTGETRSFDEIARQAKHEVTRSLLTADLERVTALLVQACERHRRQRDHTRAGLREAARETAAALAVYRTYTHPDRPVEDEDRRWIDGAIGIVARRPDVDGELLRFLRSLLLLEVRGEVEEEFALRFQQLTAPVTAKGVEDTATYRYSRLVARNEVGTDPARWSVPVEELHRIARERLASHPGGLVAASTHDTKRSADVRARIALLGEIPDRWSAAVARWSKRNERHRTGAMPDREDEHLLYQTLVGAHPLPLDRALAYMEKAAREAKRSTSWAAPDERYEDALAAFVRGALADDRFTADLDEFARPLVAAGRVASLAQTLLQLTLPGVPDIYQGNEIWDLSLVDPDDRRPVDFALRRRLLEESEALPPEAILGRMDEGLPKLHLIRRALATRARHAGSFERGAYVPLAVTGARAGHAIAFRRGEDVAVIAPRLVVGLFGDRPGRPDAWGDTGVDLPGGPWCDEMTSRPVRDGHVPIAEILAGFPVALLVRDAA